MRIEVAHTKKKRKKEMTGEREKKKLRHDKSAEHFLRLRNDKKKKLQLQLQPNK